MSSECRQGLRVLLLATCILSANLIATRPGQDNPTATHEKSAKFLLALR
ncbi:hypothetical protein [Sansalvadorimonas verongulae]|nr:hypothetical protein [Sansalvadorimonas verongulae]